MATRHTLTVPPRDAVDIDPTEVVAFMPKAKRLVTRLHPKETARLRSQFNEQVRGMFDHNVPCPNPYRFDRHHIHPLGLAGDNSMNNLAWCQKALHRAIHDHIDWEARGLPVHHSRYIWIPYMTVGRVWDLYPYSPAPRLPSPASRRPGSDSPRPAA